MFSLSQPSDNTTLEQIRSEIERMRTQIHRQRGAIKQLEKASIGTLPAEALLPRMLDRLDNVCANRDKLVGEERMKLPRHAGTDKIIRGSQMRPR